MELLGGFYSYTKDYPNMSNEYIKTHIVGNPSNTKNTFGRDLGFKDLP